MGNFGWLLAGLVFGTGAAVLVQWLLGKIKGDQETISWLIESHFYPTPTDNITISKREFPFRVRADLQRAIDRLFDDQTQVLHFCGVRREFSETLSLTDCIIDSEHYPAVSVPPEY